MLRVPHERVDNTILEIIRFRDTNEELILDSFAIAGKLNVSQDKIRASFSRLRKRLIPIVPLKKKGHKGLYIYANDENNPKHIKYIESYVNYNVKQIRTMYFNDLVKYLPMIKDDKMKKLIGQLDLVFKGETNGEI